MGGIERYLESTAKDHVPTVYKHGESDVPDYALVRWRDGFQKPWYSEVYTQNVQFEWWNSTKDSGLDKGGDKLTMEVKLTLVKEEVWD